MSREAITKAIEALKKCHYYMIDAGLPNQSMLHDAFAAYSGLEAALAEQPDETLLSFYQATDFPSLVSAMEGHIKKMQSKLQSNPHTAIDAWNNREMVRAAPLPAQPLTDEVRVPLEVLEAAESSLGSFCSDEGRSDQDMQNMDNLSAYIARHKAAHGIKEQK